MGLFDGFARMFGRGAADTAAHVVPKVEGPYIPHSAVQPPTVGGPYTPHAAPQAPKVGGPASPVAPKAGWSAAPAAAPAAAKNPWKRRALMGAGLMGAGWVGNDAMHAFNATSVQPQGPMFQTANEKLMSRLEKTANREEFTMSILERLEKTADDMALIQAISQATGAHPEEVVQMSQQDPEQFQAIAEHVMGAMQGGAEQPGQPAQPEQPAQQGVPAATPATAPAASAAQDAGGAAGGSPAAQDTTGGSPAAQDTGATQGAQVAGAAPGAQAAGGAPGGAAQVVPQGVAPEEAAGAQGAAGGADIHQLAAIGLGALLGAQQAQGGDNSRSGAASVSHNPAGVDKTASSQDLLITRLEHTVDALVDLNNANKANSVKQQEPEEKTAAELMESLEKTAEEEYAVNPIIHGAAQGGLIGSGLAGLGGAAAGASVEMGNAHATNEKAIRNAQRAGREAELIGRGGMIGHGLLGAVGGASLGILGGFVPGAVIGATHAALTHHPQTEQVASETLMDSLEKTAFDALGTAKAVGTKMLGAAKDYGTTVTGKTHAAVKNEFAAGNVGQDAVDAAGKAKNSLRVATGAGVAGGLAGAVPFGGKKQEKTAAEKEKGETEGPAADVGTNKLKGYSFLTGHYKKADDEKEDGTTIEESFRGSEGTGGPAKAEGPSSQSGLQGYTEQAITKTEKEASDNEAFMNGIYKEAAAHIIEREFPAVKVHTDPMDRIHFHY